MGASSCRELPAYVQQRMRIIQQLMAARGTKPYRQVQRQGARSLGMSVGSQRRLVKAWQELGVVGLSRQVRSDQGRIKASQAWQDFIVKLLKTYPVECGILMEEVVSRQQDNSPINPEILSPPLHLHRGLHPLGRDDFSAELQAMLGFLTSTLSVAMCDRTSRQTRGHVRPVRPVTLHDP